MRRPVTLRTRLTLVFAAATAVVLAIVGVAVLLFDVVAGFGWAVGAGVVTGLLVLGAWFVLPVGLRRQR